MVFFVFFKFQICSKKRQKSFHDFQAHSAHVDEHSDHADSTDAEHSEDAATEHAETHAEHETEHSEHSTDWASVQATWLQIGQHNADSWTKFFCSQSLWDAQNCVVFQTSQVTEPSGSHPTSAPGAHRRRLGGEHLRMHTLLTFFSSRVPNDGVSSKMVFDVWSTSASW